MLDNLKSALAGFGQAAGREPIGGPSAEFLRYGAASAVALAVDFGALVLLIGLAGLIINHFVMYGLTELALLPYAVSKVGSVGLVFSFNFSVRKAVLFTAPAAPRG